MHIQQYESMALFILTAWELCFLRTVQVHKGQQLFFLFEIHHRGTVPNASIHQK